MGDEGMKSKIYSKMSFFSVLAAIMIVFSACGSHNNSSTSSGSSPLCPMTKATTISMAAGSSLDFTNGAMPCSNGGACLQLNTSSTTGAGVGTDFLSSGEDQGLQLLTSCSQIPSSGYTDTVAADAGATYIAKINTANTTSRYALFFVQQLASSGVGSPQSPAQIQYIYPYDSSTPCPARGTLGSYTNSGSFTFEVPPCVSQITVELLGAGGGGGAGYRLYTSSTSYNAGGGGGGGGAGGIVNNTIQVSSGSSCSIVVGAFGQGSGVLSTAGQAGTASSIQCGLSSISATGGAGGAAGTITAGGTGGAGGGVSDSGTAGGNPSGTAPNNTEGSAGTGGPSGVSNYGSGGNGGTSNILGADGQSGEVIISW